MFETPQDEVATAHPAPAWQMRNELKDIVDQASPLTAGQFAERQIRKKWGEDLDPQTSLLVTLDYDYRGYPAQSGIHQGQVSSSQTLLQVALSNYQTVGDGRFGETAFGLYSPPDVGPSIRLVEKVAEFANHGSGNHQTYEGIYRQTVPQAYGPETQIALRPADFKRWVWLLDLQELYSAYLDQTWPSDQTLMAATSHPLKTSVKAAFVMSAWLQRHEQRLSEAGLELALQAAGLAPDQTWESLTINHLQAPPPELSEIKAARLKLYRYAARDIWIFRNASDARLLMYIPGNSSPLHEFADLEQLRRWVVAQGRSPSAKQALAAHFAEDAREDSFLHAGVLTALDGMAIYPRMHRLTRDAGFFNNDGYWDPTEYVELDEAPAHSDPFGQLVLTMKQAALASVKTIRDDAQVNRDNLSEVVEPIVQWITRFGPLALFVPGGEGLLALAGLIDAAYGLDQAMNAKTSSQRSEGVTRTVFGLLNAVPLAGGVFLPEGVAAETEALAKTDEVISEPPLLTLETQVSSLPRPAAPVRLALLRGIGPLVEAFSDEMLMQIGQISLIDDDMLRLMQSGRRPPTPLLADTISRFQIDQDLQASGQPQLFNSRYEALQQSPHEWVRLFQHRYPGLPKSAIEQMLDRYGVNIQMSPDITEAVQVFKRMDSKARQYQQHVRLNRAYEGLYLRSMANPDSEVLALHSLENLPGWPKKLRIDVHDQSVAGRVVDRIGPLGAADVRRLIRTGDHYRQGDLQVDLYDAVLGLLSSDERAALGLTSPDPSGRLRLHISHKPLARAELILGLDRMDSRLPFAAQGLRGGGFPETIQGAALTHEMMRLQLRDIYPELSTAEIDDVLSRAGAEAQAHIDGLNQQLQQLCLDLRVWIDQSTEDINEIVDLEFPFLDDDDVQAQGMNPAQIEARNAVSLENALRVEHAVRLDLTDDLVGIWQRCAPGAGSRYSGNYVSGYKIELDFEDYHRLPAMNVRLTEVTELSMRGFHMVERNSLDDFLKAFPNLRHLNMESVDLRVSNVNGELVSALPTALTGLRQLVSLNLKATHLQFTEPMASQLNELTRLQTLDLSDNPLGVPPLLTGMEDLRWLNLRNTRISSCPIGITDQPVMEKIDLRDNQITRIPQALINQAIAKDRLLLQGNPLTDEDTLLRLMTHRQQTGINLWLSEPGPESGSVVEWLHEGTDEQRHARQLIWERLQAKPQGSRFLRVFEGLGLTADYRVDYFRLQARVWHLLAEADASEALWMRLVEDVQVAAIDADNPFAILTVLENRARLYRDWVVMGSPFPLDAT